MPELGEFLSHLGSDRPVLYRTALQGAYDFTLLIDGQKRDLNNQAAAIDFKPRLRWPIGRRSPRTYRANSR